MLVPYLIFYLHPNDACSTPNILYAVSFSRIEFTVESNFACSLVVKFLWCP